MEEDKKIKVVELVEKSRDRNLNDIYRVVKVPLESTQKVHINNTSKQRSIILSKRWLQLLKINSQEDIKVKLKLCRRSKTIKLEFE